MTARELAALIDKAATLTVPMRDGNTLEVAVHIMDARVAFGQDHLLVTPVSGTGEAWVSADRVKVRGQ